MREYFVYLPDLSVEAVVATASAAVFLVGTETACIAVVVDVADFAVAATKKGYFVVVAAMIDAG